MILRPKKLCFDKILLNLNPKVENIENNKRYDEIEINKRDKTVAYA